MGCGASTDTSRIESNAAHPKESTGTNSGLNETSGCEHTHHDKDHEPNKDDGDEKGTTATNQAPPPPAKTAAVDESERKKLAEAAKVAAAAKAQELRDLLDTVQRELQALGTKAPRKDLPLVKQLMQGVLSVQCPSTIKTVRIFVSSTFTDTQHERNWLMEKVYPRLKEFCQGHNYDFQVVDMRWGIRDVAQDDHTTTEICLQEVELCKEQSTGPCFLSLMSHKYGYRDFPRKIPESDFDKLIGNMETEDVKNELLQWFKKDENDVPASYVLQPISVNIPNLKSDVSEIRREALSKWNIVRSEMHKALAVAAAKVLSETVAQTYKRSVSEAETMNCLSDAPKESVIWYRRIIRNIDEVDVSSEEKILKKFKDFTNNPLQDGESKKLLDQLEEEKMKTRLSQSNIKEYTVDWQPGKGIDPETNESHRKYLNQLCTDAEEHIKTLLTSAFSQREQLTEGNPVYKEVAQHTIFCQNKCNVFHGRDDSLKQIKEYLLGASNAPFVVHGPSGCGKTSIMAMAVKLTNEVFGADAVTVFRFLGTTPESTALPSLITSLITQMKLAINAEVRNMSNMTMKQLLPQFSLAMLTASRKTRLVIILDSLDQLDPSHEAHQMEWLKESLLKNVKIIVSTLPEEKYGILPILQDKLKANPGNFLAVPSLSDADIVGILDKWLVAAGRSLTPFQRTCVIDSFQKCPLPLFLKLSFDQACQWKSYMPQNLTVLQSTVRGCINELFSKMEEFHGKVFVSRALGYLTASQTGLSEAELEDILSCDEEVLNDVYRFWTPPARRLPPLLLIRMTRDLGQYVVYRGADGKQVFYWYHRQFIEASFDRYCSDPRILNQLHEGLADFFAGSWAEGRCKPYLDKDKKEKVADRYVAPQPLAFGVDLNVRRLNKQAYHRAMAGQLQLLKSECLINYKFVISKLNCGGMRALLDDFRMSRNLFPDDEELEGISEALQLSQQALSYDLKTFPSQMLGRIRNSKIQKLPSVSTFLAECRQADHMYLQPDRPILTASGGQLVHAISEQSDSINCLALNKAGTVAVTTADDGSLKTFDVQQGKLLKSVKGVAKDVDITKFACKDTLIIINGKDSLSAFDVETGSKKWVVKTQRSPHFTIGGKDEGVVILFHERTYGFYNSGTGQIIDDLKVLPQSIPVKISFSNMGPSIGHEKWAVIVDSDQTVAFVFEIESQTLVKYDRLMKPYKDKDNEKVEPTIDGLQISLDGEMLYVANYQDNDLHFFHTRTLELYKTYKGCKHDFTDKCHVSLDGKYLYFPNNNFVRVWELSTGRKATLFNRLDNKGIEDVMSSDMETFVTSCSDRNVKIWNLSRGDEPGLVFEDLPEDFEVKTNKANFLTFEPTDNPELFLVAWREKEDENELQTLSLFDVSTGSFLRQYQHKYSNDSNASMSRIKYLKDWQVMFEMNKRAKILDLKTMKIKTTFQGVLPAYCSDAMVVNNGKEVAFVTRGRMNLKILDFETGKTSCILKAGQSKRIDNVITNEKGSIVIADCEGPYLVFNISEKKFDFMIHPKDTKISDDELYLSDAHITSDGSYLLFQGEYKIEAKYLLNTGIKADPVTSIHVYNLQTRQQQHVLVDVETFILYKRIGQKDREVYVDSFKVLDDTRLVSSHDDFIIRVFDYKAGNLLRRLEGHISYLELSHFMGSPILLSHGIWSEEYGIRLWDTTNFECLAVYSYDYDMKDFQVIGSNPCRVIALLKSETQPVLFSLQGKGSDQLKAISKSTTTSKNCPNFEKSGVGELDLSDPVDLTALDEGDPDSDEEEKSDDDDVDDDDDDDLSEEEDDDAWLK